MDDLKLTLNCYVNIINGGTSADGQPTVQVQTMMPSVMSGKQSDKYANESQSHNASVKFPTIYGRTSGNSAPPEVETGHKQGLSLFDAIMNDDTASVNSMIDSDTGLLYLVDENHVTPLMQACICGNVRLVKTILDKSKDAYKVVENIDAQDNDGNTALIYATRARCATAVELLIRDGANAGVMNNDGYTATFYAVLDDNTDLVEVLTKFDEQLNDDSYFPLILKEIKSQTIIDIFTKIVEQRMAQCNNGIELASNE